MFFTNGALIAAVRLKGVGGMRLLHQHGLDTVGVSFIDELPVPALYAQHTSRLAEYHGLHGHDEKYSELNFGAGAGEAVK